MRNNKKGFTIIELVIVIAVIAILAGVLIPTFSSVTRKAKESAALQTVEAAQSILMAEENAQLTEGAIYYFINTADAKDATEYRWYMLDTDRKVVKMDNTASVPEFADSNDTVYAKDATNVQTVVNPTPDDDETLDVDESSAPVYKSNEDLGTVIIWKVVPNDGE